MLFPTLAVASLALVANAASVSDISAMKKSIIKRQSTTSPTGLNDGVILNFALTLEHLEATFYAQGLANFTQAQFTAAGFTNVYSQLQQVAKDEADHVTFLTSALSAAGVTPVQACTYKFPYTDVPSFLGLAQVLEGVGVSAYLGAAGAINSTAYLTAAAAILTVEARHSAFIRYIDGYLAAPVPYDTPFSATGVVTMATPFFVSCPTGSAPAIKPFPALTVTTTAPAAGSVLRIAPTNASFVLPASPAIVYCGFSGGLGAAFSVYTNGSCPIPTANVTASQTYVVLTTNASISDASVLAGPAIIELGTKGTGGGFAANATSTNGAGPAAGASGTAAARSAGTMTKVSVAGSIIAAAFALLF